MAVRLRPRLVFTIKVGAYAFKRIGILQASLIYADNAAYASFGPCYGAYVISVGYGSRRVDLAGDASDTLVGGLFGLRAYSTRIIAVFNNTVGLADYSSGAERGCKAVGYVVYTRIIDTAANGVARHGAADDTASGGVI